MQFRETLSMAMQSLGANKLRSGLTMIGITIGVFSVISVMTAIGALQSSMSIGKPFFENSLTCTAIGMVPTLRIMQMPALLVSVDSGELRSSVACAVPTRLNSDTAAAKLAVRIIISFTLKELTKYRPAWGLRASVV